MYRSLGSFVPVICVSLSAAMFGCSPSGPGASPELVAKHRARLVMAEEPDGVQTVLDVRELLLGVSEDAHDHAEHDHDHAHDLHDDHDPDDSEAAHDEHTGHDHDDSEHAHDEHAGHDHDDSEHAHDEHAGQDHDEHPDHQHETKPAGPMEVLMVGTIGGLTNPWEETQPDYPFASREASFFLADPGAVAEKEADGHVHAPGEECAFCAAHAEESSSLLAMVRFLGDNGEVLPVEVRRLFEVNELDTVVVKGTARIVEGGMMVVDADGLYVRR